MYNIHKSKSGIYYLRHNETNVLANTDKWEFIYKLVRYINPTLSMADSISYSLFIGDFETTNELINL